MEVQFFKPPVQIEINAIFTRSEYRSIGYTAYPSLPVFLCYDIDNSSSSIWLVLYRRIGYELNTLDNTRRDLPEGVISIKCTGFSIDKDCET